MSPVANRKQYAIVVGARPNMIKVAPLLRELEQRDHVETFLIHTGQHYDPQLSAVFFHQLGIRQPDVSLGIGSGTHGAQTGRILEKIEGELLRRAEAGKPVSRMIVVGDVNSTLAGALAAVKLQIPVAHIEAGLRSHDRTMPEEINRIVTDAVADVFFVTEPAGVENLIREGHPPDRIHWVGNLMIDTLLTQLPIAERLEMPRRLQLRPKQYAVLTLHRPGNVDEPEQLGKWVDGLTRLAQKLTIVFPVHPRTRARLAEFKLLAPLESTQQIQLLEPLGYVELLSLVNSAAVVITDSGGLQEETTCLGVPCLTLRETTERPITIDQGTSTLVGQDVERMLELVDAICRGDYKSGQRPQHWDGHTARRIVQILCKIE